MLFKENDKVTGERAKLSVKPELCAYDSKRFLYKRFDDPSIQRNMKYYSFNLVKDINGNPIEVSSYILKQFYKEAKTLIGEDIKITDVVITVPAYFNTN